MTRRLGGNGRRKGFAILSTVSLATALALGGTMAAGCGGGGSTGGGDSGTGGETGVVFDSGTGDTGKADTGTPDTGTPDTGVIDTGTPDTFVAPQCPAPSFAPPDGTQFTASGDVTISDSNLPTGGFIYYTTDGTNPNTNSKVYSGPIQVTQNTTFRAAAAAPGCNMSTVAVASYTVVAATPCDASTCPLPPVTFVQTSQTQPNDFLVSLTDQPGATICYTEDGSTPTCSNGQCTGTSSTYSSSSRVSINGTVTDITTGQVTITAIACEAGYTDSPAGSQQYTLQAAAPTMIGLVNGDQPWAAAPPNGPGFQPTISSLTQSSINPPNGSTIRYTQTATAPSCSTGTQIANPTTFNTGATGSPTLTQTNGTLQAIACKTGYLPSTVSSWTYTFTLNTPSITGGTFFALPTVVSGSTAGAGVVVDTANSLSGDTLCATTDGNAPTCTASGGCATTNKTEVAVTSSTGPNPGNATSANTTIMVVACAPAGVNSSASSSATFTLQYAAPFLWTNYATTVNLPGWDSTATGAPVTSFALPSDYASAVAFPYGTSGDYWAAGQVQGPAANCDEFNTTGCTANQKADYYCFSTTATADCTCTSGSTNYVTAGGLVAAVNGAQLPGNNGGAGTAAGSTLSVIACQNPAPTTVWASSAATNMAVSAPGGATAPAISAPTANPYNTQATVTVTNQDKTSTGSVICWSYAKPAITPTCDTTGAAPTCYKTAIPACTQGTNHCGSFSLAPSTDKTGGNVFTLLPGGTDSSPVTASVIHTEFPWAGTGPSHSSDNVGTDLGGLVQQDGFVLSAIACNTTETPSAPATQTYHFQVGQPDISSLKAYSAGSYGDLDTNGSAVGAGQPVYLTSVSNYDTLFSGGGNTPSGAESLHFRTAASGASCGDPEIDLFGVLSNGKSLSDVWDLSVFFGGQPVQDSIQSFITQGTPTQLYAPTAGSSWTLSTIGCGESGTVQTQSAPRNVSLSLAAALPVITTDQDTDKNLGLDSAGGLCSTDLSTCGPATTPCCTCSTNGGSMTNPTTPLPVCCSKQATQAGSGGGNSAPASCTPQTKWENSFNVYVSSTTPGNSLCVSTTAMPSCNNGVCVGATNQASPVKLSITSSPVTVYAIGCAPNLPASNPVQQPFDIATTGAVLLPGTGGSCGSNPILQLNTDTSNSHTANTADIAEGGPSPNICLCYDTDNTPLKGVCDPVNCPTNPQGATTVTCYRPQSSTPSYVTLPLTTSATVNWVTCSTGFDQTLGSPTFSTSPYRETIAPDGNLSEWDQSTWGNSGTNDDAPVTNIDERNNGSSYQNDDGSDGLFTYDDTNLYFGFAPNYPFNSPMNYIGEACNGTALSCAGGAAYPQPQYTYMTVYIGNGISGGALTELPNGQDHRETVRYLPPNAGIRWAFQWLTGTTTAPVAWAWDATSSSWKSASFPVGVGYGSGTQQVEFSVPWAQLGLTASSNVTAVAMMIGDIGDGYQGTIGNNLIAAWPDDFGNYWAQVCGYWQVNMASCSAPSAQGFGSSCHFNF